MTSIIYKVSVGFIGPTDETLILHRNDESKEYLIESEGWRALSFVYATEDIVFDESYAWYVLDLIWHHGKQNK